jgi:hypothetical protein
VHNVTGQDLQLKINASAALNDLPTGTWAVIAQSSLPTTVKLTAVSLTTTGAQSADPGYIEYFVFGDPV